MKAKTVWEKDNGDVNQRRWVLTSNPLKVYLGYSCDARWVNCYGMNVTYPVIAKRSGPILGDSDES